jgi:hypothetical protein
MSKKSKQERMADKLVETYASAITTKVQAAYKARQLRKEIDQEANFERLIKEGIICVAD